MAVRHHRDGAREPASGQHPLIQPAAALGPRPADAAPLTRRPTAARTGLPTRCPTWLRTRLQTRPRTGPRTGLMWAGLLLGSPLWVGCAGGAGAPSFIDDGLRSRYVAPAPGQPAARLLFRAAVAPGQPAMLLRYRDALRCQQAEGLVGAHPVSGAPPVQIAAGELTLLDLMIFQAGRKSACVVRFSFTPEAGASYLVNAANAGAGCIAQLLDVSQPERPQPVPDAVYRARAGQPCLALADAPPMRGSAPSVQGGQDSAGEAVLDPRATARDLQGLIAP